MSNRKILLSLAFLLLVTLGYAQVVNNETQLNNAISAASAGSTIILANGTWNNVDIDIIKNGSASGPITITAQTPGSVLMTGNSRVYMEGSYITVSGLVFQNPSNLGSGSTITPVFDIKECDYCKVLNNKIDNYNAPESDKTSTFKWILTDGQYNEIAYNSFIGKYGIGSIINDNRNSPEPDYLTIHHNYFADRTPINGVNDDNDQDAIRIGNSATSLDDSFSEVYENYFHNFFGEVEMISNKSGNNKYYKNTFRNYAGTLTLRHGDDCEVYNNAFFAENNNFSGGVRVIGEGHKVYNNYIEGTNATKDDGSTSNAVGGINVSNGRQNTELNGYYQVIDAEVINNTFVNCDYALRIGTQVKTDLFEEPVNLIVANNIMYNTSIDPYEIVTSPSGASVSEGNITNLPNSALTDDGSFHRLTAGSSPIGAGLGSYSYLTTDFTTGVRDANFDAGAEEFGSNGPCLPYVLADVGSKIGFGALSAATLSVSPSVLNFGLCGGTTTFEVTGNVDWTITENLSWLSLDITSGTGTTTVTATTTQNTTGGEQTGTITIDEVPGGDDLTESVSVIQSNTLISGEIPTIGTTSIGMQIGNPNVAEINSYDDDITTYWTGNPDFEPEVSITFDLGSSYELTEIGINFWRSNERTTTFSIQVSDNAAGPFTTVLNNVTSSVTALANELPFSLGNTVGRYVKFIGIGNSSSTNWTSLANVNIYGTEDCEIEDPVVEDNLCIGTGTSSSATRGPWQRSNANSSSVFSRSNLVYTAAELSSMTAGSIISQISWDLGSANVITASGNAIATIYMKNSSSTGAAADTWANMITGSTIVGTYIFNTTNNFPGVKGYLDFPIADFVYTGGALEIAVDWDASGLIPVDPAFPNQLLSGNGSLNWRWSATAHNSTIYSVGSNNAPTLIDDNLKAERVNTCFLFSSTTVLPVELISFDGKMENAVAYLNWETASEDNNDYFEIEQSSTGRNFASIGTVEGSGTSSVGNQYSFVDKYPTIGDNYYRLKQVDFDGGFAYSNTIYLQNKSNDTPVIVYPNPAKDVLTYEGIPGILTIYDVFGKKVIKQVTTEEKLSLDISQLENGAFIIEISTATDEKIFKRFIKTN